MYLITLVLPASIISLSLRPRYIISVRMFGNILQKRMLSEKLVVVLAFSTQLYSAWTIDMYYNILRNEREQVDRKSLEKFFPLPFIYFEAYNVYNAFASY